MTSLHAFLTFPQIPGLLDVTEHGLGNWQSVVQVQYYMLEVEDHHLSTSDASDTMNFWNNRVSIYDKLSLIAQDILAASASQAYVERGFPVCGLLTAGRTNRIANCHCKCELV